MGMLLSDFDLDGNTASRAVLMSCMDHDVVLQQLSAVEDFNTSDAVLRRNPLTVSINGDTRIDNLFFSKN
jgi:hypothetical protein